MKNIILFATYWNEKHWIDASLEQIKKIDPIEIIICDGCFDPNYPPYSTDGTREIIKKFVQKQDNATLISPLRYSKIKALFEIFKGHQKNPKIKRFTPARLNILARAALCNIYRLNQALTFNYMISISRYWKNGRWFMTYDSDQFYSDNTLINFSKVNKETNLGLLVAEELTFFSDMNRVSKDYEKRTYNNMPHRIFKNTAIIPTRDLMIENNFTVKHYIKVVDVENIGYYFHYKNINPQRYSLGYLVGDRKKPDIAKYRFKKFDGEHPSIIKNLALPTNFKNEMFSKKS